MFIVVLAERSNLRGRWRAVVRSGEEGGSFLTIIFGACGPLDELGERLPSARICIELSLEVGDALSLAGFELLEFGVATWEVLNGAIVAYVRELPTCSADEGASGVAIGGAATAVVILFGGVCSRTGL